MAVDVSRIPNNNKFDPVREAILQLQTSIDETGAAVGNGTLTIGTSGSLTGSVTFTANQSSNSTITIGIDDSDYLSLSDTGEQTIAGDIVISGDLTISGTTTFIDTTHLNIGDNIITLNADLPSTTAPTEDAGIAIYRGSSATKSFLWNETSDKWTLGSETLIAGTFEGNLTGNVTGDVTGNASTASALATARNIAVDGAVTGNADFDGSGDITITTSVNHNHDDRYYTETESDNRFVNVGGDTMTGSLTIDDSLTITGTTNNLVIDETADGTWEIYDSFQNNGIIIHSTTSGMEFQYNGSTEMTIDGGGVTFNGTIDLSNANLNIGSADIVFGIGATDTGARGLVWNFDADGNGVASNIGYIRSGGTLVGEKLQFNINVEGTITGSNSIYEFKNAGTDVVTISADGDVTATTFIGDLTGNVTGDVEGTLTGSTRFYDLNGTVQSLFGVYAWDTELQFNKRNITTDAFISNLLTLDYSTSAATFSGNVTAPTFIGDLQGNADTATNADTVDNKHATDFTLQYVTDNNASTTNAIAIGQTASASQALHVDGNIIVGGQSNGFIHGGGRVALSADGDIIFVTDANDTGGATPDGKIIFGGGSLVDTNADQSFTFADAFGEGVPRNEWARLIEGKFGIGETDPDTKLHITEEGVAPVLLTLQNTQVSGDIQNDGTTGNFIDFISTDANTNFTPQVRIGMVVQDYDADNGIISEGVGNFVVYTGQGTDDLGAGTLTESFRVREDNGIQIFGTNNDLIVREVSENEWHIYDTFQDNGIIIHSSTGGMEFQYNGVTEMTVDANGVSVVGGIDLSDANLDIGSADIVFGIDATDTGARGLVWNFDADGNGTASNIGYIRAGGTLVGEVMQFNMNAEGTVTGSGSIYEFKNGGTNVFTIGADGSIEPTGDIILPLNTGSLSHGIVFEGVADSGGEVGIRANGEAFEIYEPEQSDKVWLSIADDPQGNGIAAQLNSPDGFTPILTNYNKGSYITKAYIDGLNVDADTLDSLNSTQFLRSDESDTINGALTVFHSTFNQGLILHRDHAGNAASIRFTNNTGNAGTLYATYADTSLRWNDGDTTNGHLIWHSGNDGSGSNLDADKLDGLQASQFLRSDQDDTTTGTLTIQKQISANGIYYPFIIQADDTGNTVNQLEGDGIGLQFKLANNLGSGSFLGGSIAAVRESGSDDNSSTRLEFYTSNNDETLDKQLTIDSSGNLNVSGTITGNGSGLTAVNATTLDTLDSTQFLRSDANDSTSGELTINGGKLTVVNDAGNRPKIGFQESVGVDSFVLEYNGVGSGAGNYVSFYSTATGWAGLGQGLNYIPENGRVGIGEISPDSILHLSSSEGNTVLTIEADTDNNNEDDNPQIHFLTDGGLRTGAISAGNATYESNANTNSFNFQGNSLRFHTATTQDFDLAEERMRIDPDGKVGIGEVSPSYPLHVSGKIYSTTEVQGGVATMRSYGGYAFFGSNASTTPLAFGRDGTSYDLTINGSGHVGVGMTSATYPFEVATANFDTGMRIVQDTGTGYAPASILLEARQSTSRGSGIYHYNTQQDTSWYSGTLYNNTNLWGIAVKTSETTWNPDVAQTTHAKFVVDSGGRIGIGIASPQSILHISADQPYVYLDDTSTSGTRNRFQLISGDVGTTQSAIFSFNNTSGTSLLDVMTINENGRIGIGTTDPSDMLHLKSTGDVQIRLEADTDNVGEDDNPSILLVQDGGAVSGRLNLSADNNLQLINQYDGAVQIGQNNSPNFTIDNTGKFAFGSALTTASHFMQLYDDTPFICITNTAETLHGIRFEDAQATSSQNALFGYNCQTNHIEMWINNTKRFQFNSDGNLHADNDITAFSTSVSDARLKDDVSTIDNALDKVLSMRGVQYVWNKGSRKGQKDLGVIAQEVEEVLPEIVREKEMPLLDDSGEKYKTVDYEKLTGVLIEAIKEQQKQIDELKSKLDGITN